MWPWPVLIKLSVLRLKNADTTFPCHHNLPVQHRHQSCYKCRLFPLLSSKVFISPPSANAGGKCISSEVTTPHLPCYPRTGSQARESITNLKISDEAALKCFTSDTVLFPFFKAKQEMHHFRMDPHHQRDLQFCPRVGNILTNIQKCY